MEGLAAGLAQLVEHLICNQGVGGSSPSVGTTYLFVSNDLFLLRSVTVETTR